MRHGSLFSGIGGFDLAAEWMGWENVFQVEIDDFCQKVLKKNFPDVERFGDIKEFDGTKYRGCVDIITGGFPCQPFSTAGNRSGKYDDRFIWPEMLRVIGEIKPRWVVAENVFGLLNIDNGITADMVCSNLEAIGYERPIIFDCTANCFGLPTMERHIWFISEAACKRCEGSEKVTHQDNGNERKFSGTNKRINYRRDISESRFCDVGERVSRKMDRNQRGGLVAGGNAIVPQVAYEIFKTIAKCQTYYNLSAK